MNTNIKALFFTFFIIYCVNSMACPTCIGRLALESPAFFNDELNTHNSIDPESELETEE